jgi:hypothetical protein
VAERALSLAEKSAKPVRRKCFLSYHSADVDEVAEFIESYSHVFVPKVIGISDDDAIDSDDSDYVFDRIREKYLQDSTVTIVLVGKCTWARRYVDWEVYSSLRNDSKNRRSGLLAITLKSTANYVGKRLPDRVDDNVSNTSLYARWKKYPTSDDDLAAWIEDAYNARTTRAHLINNTRVRKKYNSTCP